MTCPELKAVAWDIDGTLIDSEPLHLKALVAVSAEYGVDLSSEPDERFRGVHMGNVWLALKDLYPDDLNESVWNERIIDYYAAHADELQPMRGAIETIKVLAELGVPQVCVSNSSRRVVDTNIRSLGIKDCLSGSISLCDVKQGKPDPEGYRKGADLLGVRPENVLAVEDSQTGAMAAQRAGLCLAFYAPPPPHPQGAVFFEADLTISDLQALPARFA